MQILLACFLSLLLGGAASAQNASISHWQFGQRKLRLESRDNDRTFIYEELPDEFARQAGIAPGAIFWQGQRIGDKLIGQMMIYQKGCSPLPFSIQASATLNGNKEIIFVGTPPLEADCKPSNRMALPDRRVLRLIRAPKTFKDLE